MRGDVGPLAGRERRVSLICDRMTTYGDDNALQSDDRLG
jgi:hypothetical protein